MGAIWELDLLQRLPSFAPCKMLPTYRTGKIEHAKNCVCSNGRYHVPMVSIFNILGVPVLFML